MKYLYLLLIVCLIISASSAQIRSTPLSNTEVCKKYSDSVVQIDTDRPSHATGFIVSPDGWIITAAHVVIDENRTIDTGITVTLPKIGKTEATEVMPIDDLLILRDFAILKVKASDLPYIELGNEDDIGSGASLAIIGFPLSAALPYNIPAPKFCLFGTVAAQTSFPVGKSNHLDTIYFQGVSIKGISGSPIISLDTGKVVGIVSTRLTGISKSLEDMRPLIAKGFGSGIIISGMDPGKTVGDILDVLDTQLANGLGSGTGAADAEYALRKAKRDYDRHRIAP